MSDPTNTDITTAQDLGSLVPISVGPVQQFFAAGFNTLWWKLTVPAGVEMLGVFLKGDFSRWFPVLTVYRGTVGSPDAIISGAISRPIQFEVTAGETIFFESVSNPTFLPINSPTTLDIYTPSSAYVPAGSILINDSSPGFPGVAVSITDGSVLRFFPDFPAGESSEVLNTGQVMIADAFTTNGPIIYDVTMTPQYIPTMPAAGYVKIGTDQTTGWWVMKPGGGAVHATIVFVDTFGVTSGTTYDLGGSSAGSAEISPNIGDSKVYFIQNTSNVNKPVQQITIPGGVVSNFIAGDPSFILRSTMVTMLDDTLLVAYTNVGFTTNEVRQYNAAGTLIKTFSFGLHQVEAIFTAINDPAEFWVWTEDSTHNFFQLIRASDGAVLTSLSNVQFIEGKSQSANQTDPPEAYFGTDFSCVPFIPRVLITSHPPVILTPPIPCCVDSGVPTANPRTPGSGPGTSPTNPGDITPFVTAEWMPVCAGGGVVPTQADLIDVESWT